MANGTEVLREYLLSLGFRVNATESRKFDNVLGKINKSALLTGGSIVGIATGVAAMVNSFAAGMEKLFYASKRAGATVGNLQAIEFGGKQIGLAAGAATNAVLNMAGALRRNPALAGVLQQLGVKVEGRDMSDVAKDMVRALKPLMASGVAYRFASLFGMDDDTLFMMSQNMDKMDEAAAKRKQMNADAGVDADAAAEAAVRYRNLLDETTTRAGVLKDALAIALLPTMQSAVEWSNQFLQNITRAVTGDKQGGLHALLTGAGEAGSNLLGYKGSDPFPKYNWGGAGKSALGGLQAAREWMVGLGDRQAGRNRIYGAGLGPNSYGSNNPGIGAGQGVSDAKPAGGKVNQRALLAQRVEEKYGLPDGLLYAMMQQESSGDANAVSPTGVRGLMQITGTNRKRLGIGMDDEGQFDGAARMMVEGLDKYKGDLSKALTYYNAGTDRDLLGKSQAQNYAPSVMRKMEQYNTFTITGNNAAGIADAVGQRLEVANGNLLRDMKGNVR